MATNYIAVQPGVSGQYPTVSLTAFYANGVTITGSLTVPSLQDITINNSNDVFNWTQLNETGKLAVATTSTNSIATNLVLEDATWFGSNITAGGTDTAVAQGINGLSRNKQKCKVVITNAIGSKTITANCYVTGLAATVSADSPVWLSPVTFNVTGDYVIS